MEPLSPDDPRVQVSDKTYVAFKALDMGFDAHMTVMYLGKISVLQERLAQTVIDEYISSDNYADRLNIRMFGPDNDIPVVTLAPPVEVWGLRKKLEQHSYLPNPSAFEFHPHITLKPESGHTLHIPATIRLVDLGLY